MITDITTILWKEMKEILHQRGRIRGGWVGLVMIIGVFGVFLPLQSGPAWISSPFPLVFWSWVPFVLVGGIIADSFAGERERHTLETLLASRLTDKAILMGKIAAAIFYGWGLAMVCALLSVIAINIAYMKDKLIFYSWTVAIAIPIFSFLIAGLASGLGVFISLRSSTVRQAHQTFSLIYFFMFIPLFAIPVLPKDIQARAAAWIMETDAELIATMIGCALLVLDAGLLAAALGRFKRNKLILD